MKDIGIRIDKEESVRLTEIKCGSHADDIAIILHQGNLEYTIFSWNVSSNTENEAYDVEAPFETIWDSTGALYILNAERVIFTKEKCAIKAFQF